MRQFSFRHERQLGVALITALLVVSLATVAAVAMATRLHIDLRRSGNLLHGEQAYAYALAAESWAQVILKRDAGDNDTDSYLDDWATSLPPIAVEGGLVDGEIRDRQGRFNVNNLVGETGTVDQPYVDYLERLLENLELDPQLATALLDWIDTDVNATFPGGVEDETYLLADPPYRAANRRLVDISELRLVEGFTPEVMEALLPHVTALPDAAPINVNTASAQVLLALDPNLDGADVEGLITLRDEEAFDTVDEFLAQDALAGLTPTVDIAVTSEWFELLTDVVIGTGRARLSSLIERKDDKTRIISRTRARHYLLPGQV